MRLRSRDRGRNDDEQRRYIRRKIYGIGKSFNL
jgi:hypothetical protein